MKTSPEVCFVCGSKGALNSLLTRPNGDGQPYFSFLESHVPPRGARRPNELGAVGACTVCCAFLNQQWDAFERSRTPLVKRLYWLKRVDNGAFTGAEMSVQGEYMAQLMGLHGISSSADVASPFCVSNHTGIACGTAPSPIYDDDDEESISSEGANTALDLSVSPRKSPFKVQKSHKSHANQVANGPRKKGSTSSSDSIVCYICGVVCPSSLARFIYAAQHSSDEPFFPFVLALCAPPGAMPVTKTGVTRVCADCRKSLTRQWRVFESRGVSIQDRQYKVGNFSSDAEQQDVKDITNISVDRREVACYICAEATSFTRTKTLSARVDSGSCMSLPFIASLKRPSGACPITAGGLVRVCDLCYGHFQAQWQQFEAEGTPISCRHYALRPVKQAANKPLAEPTSSCVDTLRHREVLRIPAVHSNTVRDSDDLNIDHVSASYTDSAEKFTNPSVMKPENTVFKGVTLCYLCGMKCYRNPSEGTSKVGFVETCHELYTRPSDGESDAGRDSKAGLLTPFFPFLAHVSSESSSERPRGQRGAASVCAVCHCCLMRQWKSYEQCGEEQNPWCRNYSYRTCSCDLCHKELDRKYIVAVTAAVIKSKHFQHKDDVVLLCLNCCSSNPVGLFVPTDELEKSVFLGPQPKKIRRCSEDNTDAEHDPLDACNNDESRKSSVVNVSSKDCVEVVSGQDLSTTSWPIKHRGSVFDDNQLTTRDNLSPDAPRNSPTTAPSQGVSLCTPQLQPRPVPASDMVTSASQPVPSSFAVQAVGGAPTEKATFTESKTSCGTRTAVDSRVSPSVSRQQPAFYRPFLDESSETASPHRGVSAAHHSNDSGKIVHDETSQLASVATSKAVQNPFGATSVESATSDVRLNAALSLISLGNANELTHLDVEKSCKRAKLDLYLVNNSHHRAIEVNAKGVEGSQSDAENHGNGWSVGNTAENGARFVWPGIGAVIEAYLQHHDGMNMERGFLIEQRQLLKNRQIELVDELQEMELRLQVASKTRSELEKNRIRLQDAVVALRNCLRLLPDKDTTAGESSLC